MGQSAADIIHILDLKPHPEGGWYTETWRAPSTPGTRASGTAIYYLLEAGQSSHWHRVDADEIWHWYAGAPLALSVSKNGHDAMAWHLGPILQTNQRPQRRVPAGWWQTAVPLGAWTLVGCTVSPGFEFSGFEMAPENWHPAPRTPQNI